MKHSLELALLLAALGAFACSSDDDGGDDGDDAPPDEQTEVAAIEGALGKANRPSTPGTARIDRAGRPAISAALISTFNPDAREADLDRYNTSGNANPAFIPIIAGSLGILDGLDRQCGNQLLAGADVAPGRYDALATVLVDDQVYVQSDRPGASSIYLGVEAEALGAGQGAGGGRAPGDDVIERSYSVLAAGVLSGVDDGVPADDAQHDIDVFPFLAEPQ
jgi:hypothetical protein